MANKLSINTHRNESIIYIHDQTPTPSPSPNPIKATVELQRHQRESESERSSRQLSISQSGVSAHSVSISESPPVSVLEPHPVSVLEPPQVVVPKPNYSSRFWKMLILSIILGLVMGFIIWELNVETQLRSDYKSHEVSTREQLLNETTLSCGKLYQIGYKTNPGIVFTRDLIFDCPFSFRQCSCDVYSDQWIMKQPLYNIYYQDSDPTDWSNRPSDPRVGQFVGLMVGVSICGFFFIFTLGWLINYCYPCSKDGDGDGD